MPETVKYGISNLTRIGAFRSGVASSAVILGRWNSALNIYSYIVLKLNVSIQFDLVNCYIKLQTLTLFPGKDLIFQTNASFSGAYEADPRDVLTVGLDASVGTGNSISTFVAVLQSKELLSKRVQGFLSN